MYFIVNSESTAKTARIQTRRRLLRFLFLFSGMVSLRFGEWITLVFLGYLIGMTKGKQKHVDIIC